MFSICVSTWMSISFCSACFLYCLVMAWSTILGKPIILFESSLAHFCCAGSVMHVCPCASSDGKWRVATQSPCLDRVWPFDLVWISGRVLFLWLTFVLVPEPLGPNSDVIMTKVVTPYYLQVSSRTRVMVLSRNPPVLDRGQSPEIRHFVQSHT